jgi:hypothetical protein
LPNFVAAVEANGCERPQRRNKHLQRFGAVVDEWLDKQQAGLDMH